MKLYRAATVLSLMGALSGGCAMVLDDNSVVYSAAPGKYDYLDCSGIAKISQKNEERTAELTALMDRAKTDPMGPLVNNMVYRDEYNTKQADQAALRKVADEKRCPAIRPQPASLTPMH